MQLLSFRHNAVEMSESDDLSSPNEPELQECATANNIAADYSATCSNVQYSAGNDNHVIILSPDHVCFSLIRLSSPSHTDEFYRPRHYRENNF